MGKDWAFSSLKMTRNGTKKKGKRKKKENIKKEKRKGKGKKEEKKKNIRKKKKERRGERQIRWVVFKVDSYSLVLHQYWAVQNVVAAASDTQRQNKR